MGEVLRWYDAIVASVTEITAGGPPSEDGRRGYDALRAAIEPGAGRATRTPRSWPPRPRRGRARARRGGLQRRGAAVRRDRDDGGDDRQRGPAPALASRRARRGAARRRPAGRRRRGVAAARAGRRGRGPLRDARRRARRRADRRARARRRLDRGGEPRSRRLRRPRPLRPAAREREAPPGLRARPARVHRDAPRAAGGPHRRRAACWSACPGCASTRPSRAAPRGLVFRKPPELRVRWDAVA